MVKYDILMVDATGLDGLLKSVSGRVISEVISDVTGVVGDNCKK